MLESVFKIKAGLVGDKLIPIWKLKLVENSYYGDYYEYTESRKPEHHIRTLLDCFYDIKTKEIVIDGISLEHKYGTHYSIGDILYVGSRGNKLRKVKVIDIKYKFDFIEIIRPGDSCVPHFMNKNDKDDTKLYHITYYKPYYEFDNGKNSLNESEIYEIE